jgi:CheY-like chemotaxis protein
VTGVLTATGGGILHQHPVAAAYAQVATAFVALVSFWWASRYARRPKTGPPQRRINSVEGVAKAKWVCNPGRRSTDRCASCPLDDTCLKNLPPISTDEALRDQAAALLVAERVARHQSKSSVVFVDDNAELRMVVEALLNNDGVNVRLASSVAEALPFREHEDLLITDWRLPDGSGGDVLRAFREARPRKPVMVVSAVASPPGDMPPYVTWVSKPFDVDQFVDLVHLLLRG